MKKIALATAAVGIGSVLLGSKDIVPESSAKTQCCCPGVCGACNFIIENCLVVDEYHQNNGTLSCAEFGKASVISFGGNAGVNVIGGEAIGSAQVCGSPNLKGLDFYTNFTKRASITNCGKVGIGTANPHAPLSFGNGSSQDKIYLYDGTCCKYGFGIWPGQLRIYDGEASNNHISFGKYNGKCFTEFVRINNQGQVGIGTITPSTTLQVCGSFSAHYPGCGAAVHGAASKGTGVLGCSTCSVGVIGAGKLYGVQGCALDNCGRHVGVIGTTGSGPGSAGVAGYSNGGTSRCCSPQVTAGVYGQSDSYIGQGVSGVANPVAGCGAGVGVIGRSNGLCGIGIKGVAGTVCTVPIVASGATCQFANLQEWEKGSTTLSVVNKCGWLGINTCKPQTTFQVNGGVSLGIKTETLTKCYTMKTTCFAILANPSTTGKNVTLPAAKNSGMVVYIKNISANAVTVKAAGTDHIENSTTTAYSLAAQASVTMIASGGPGDTWYVLSTGS